MNTSEVLHRGADHIQRYGLAKHRLHGPGDPQTAPACSLGAIIIGAGAEGSTGFLDSPDARAGGMAFTRYLGGGIAQWNNAPERTATDVVAALRAAAAIEQARETARGPLSTGPTVRVPVPSGGAR